MLCRAEEGLHGSWGESMREGWRPDGLVCVCMGSMWAWVWWRGGSVERCKGKHRRTELCTFP